MPDQNIPNVPQQNPGQSTIDLPSITNPFLSIWWATQTVSGVPENVMGWLVAQGYEITGITQDTTTVPPTNYFSLTREGMKPLQVLLSLCNSYTVAANDARDANELRYNEVISNWTEMISTSHDQFDAQTEEQNAQAGLFLTDLDDYMTAVETLISDNQTQLATDATESKTALLAMDLRLEDLETNASDNSAIIIELLTEQRTNLDSYIAEYDAQLSQLNQNVVDHITEILSQIDSLGTVLNSHVSNYLSQIDQLSVNYNFHLADIDGILGDISSNVSTYIADVDSILASMSTDYASLDSDIDTIRTTAGTLVDDHVADYGAVLDLLESDFDSQNTITRSIINFLLPDFTDHASETRSITSGMLSDYVTHSVSATGFLDGLGATELARINEQSAASLSSQLQMLVSRGFYTSTIPVDVTERNWRDRDEQIQLLNDRLNREKFENQHKLYEQQRTVSAQILDNEHRLFDQQRSMRSQIIDANQRLYEQQLNMRARTLDGKSQIHSVRQEVLRYQASLITGVYSLLQETRNRVLAGKQAIFAAKDAKEKLNIEVRSQLYSKLQDIRARVIEGTDRIYQLRDVFSKWENAETHRTYEQLQQIRSQFVEAAERQHTAKQTVVRTEMSQRDSLLQQIQTALTGLLSGKERFSTLLLQLASTLSEHKHKAIMERMNTAVQRLEGWKSVAADNRALMAYQLDERNKLLVGLYSFVERRDDIAPEWKDMASMIAGLGDSGGGWIQP